jgi:hypothetical protein
MTTFFPSSCDPGGGEVYRALRDDEDPTPGLVAKNPDAHWRTCAQWKPIMGCIAIYLHDLVRVGRPH